MVKAGDRVMQAFASLDGIMIQQFLQECLDAKMAEALETDVPGVYRAQGAALELKELVALAKNSRERLHST